MRYYLLLTSLIFLVLSGCYHQDSVHQKLKMEAALEIAAVQLVRETMAGQYGLLITSELHQILKGGIGWLLLDVRAESNYLRGHIPGALNFTFPKGIVADSDWGQRLMEGRQVTEFVGLLGPDKKRMLIFSCGRTRCARAHNAALWAVRLGYNNVFRHPGGIDAWMGAGYGITK